MNRRGMQRGRWVAFELAIILVLSPLCGCNSGKKGGEEVVRPVKTMVINPGEDTRLRTFPGTVDASRRVELAFRVAGQLVKLPVKEGQKIAKGELIAQLRQDEFRARLSTLQGQLEQARAQLRALEGGERPEEVLRREAQVRAALARVNNARSEYDRNSRLVRNNVVSRQAFEQSQAAYRVATAELTAARKSLDQATVGREEDIAAMEAQVRSLEGRVVEAEIELGDTTMTAPYDGVIARRFVDEQQNIRPNEPVVQFQDVDEIEIAVDVPEAVMAAEIRLADIIRKSGELSAVPGIEFPVRIREIAQVADPVTQTFKVRVAMEAPPDVRVLPGMSARVTVEYRRASILGDRLFIPIEAVAETSEGKQVAWVLQSDGVVAPRVIKLGAASAGRVEVVQGLKAGDRIVVAGVRFLRDGMKVRDLGDALGGVAQ